MTTIPATAPDACFAVAATPAGPADAALTGTPAGVARAAMTAAAMAAVAPAAGTPGIRKGRCKQSRGQ